ERLHRLGAAFLRVRGVQPTALPASSMQARNPHTMTRPRHLAPRNYGTDGRVTRKTRGNASDAPRARGAPGGPVGRLHHRDDHTEISRRARRVAKEELPGNGLP